MFKEPRWKSLITIPDIRIFSPEQCQNIIDAGHKQKSQEATYGKGKYNIKKELRPSVGFHLRYYLTCIK